MFKRSLIKLLTVAAILVTHSALAFQPIQKDNLYQVYLNLNHVQDDRLPVEIVTPIVHEDSVEFQMPRIVPGTYDIYNFGRFVNDLQAWDGNGKELKVSRIDTNRWMIHNATKLYKITYKADDSYDYKDAAGIFQPAGTSLEDSVYLLNNFGFVGYLKGYKDVDFELEVAKPKGFYGSTAMIGKLSDTLDTYHTKDYFTLHDNPILYCRPDTASRMVGGAKILVSVYSPDHQDSASKALQKIGDVLDAASQYLGGKLPVKKYAVLIYSVPLSVDVSSYGALEHHASTVIYMPEFADADQYYGGVRNITSHEFFHIITPLGIHSQMIANFNFQNPEMSENLWFYEGVTEYNSHLVQVRSGIYDIDKFLDVLHEKMVTADRFNKDIPLTIDSKFTLNYFNDQFYNFYQKGAISGMVLDLKLLELSDGKYHLIDLLKDLGNTYGPDTFFVDNKLFDIITALTYPEMREFFARYYESTEPFPLKELLANVGIDYQEEVAGEKPSIGEVTLGFNFETKRLQINSVDSSDEYTRSLGFQVGDEIKEFNGTALDLSNVQQVLSDFFNNARKGDKFKVVVARPDGKDGYKDVKLKSKVHLKAVTKKHVLKVMDNPTAKQLELRKKWINQ